MTTEYDEVPPEGNEESPEKSLDETVRLRAYEISQSSDAGTPEEDWERAEREVGA